MTEEHPASQVSRRQFLLTAGLPAVAVASCAPQTGAPSPATPSAQAPGRAKWEEDWDALVTAARQEGKVVVLTLSGPGWRKGLDAFADSFGIAVEQAGNTAPTIWVPKIQRERLAGIYAYDVATVLSQSALTLLRPDGVWDNLRALLFRPDVLDDAAWYGGFESRFMDLDRQLAFGWEYSISRNLYVNTDLVSAGEIKTPQDLLNPKWKGKIILADVRLGGTFNPMASLRSRYGDGFVKQLLVDQEPGFGRDVRMITEQLIRGRYAIALYMQLGVLDDFRSQGVGGNVRVVNLPEIAYVRSNAVLGFNRAPHPNAAKLFINWLLTKGGQMAFCKGLGTNSARRDVEAFDAEGKPEPGQQSFELREQNFAKIENTQKFLQDLVGIKD